MATIFWLCGLFILWCAGVWLAERRHKDVLPDPDRSVKRNIQITDEMERLKAARRRQG